ncbi:response regulator transcription factor [Edaphobacter modestus]|uniref:Winged helix family two component transcriptional regulator n=1 Tax=Edaphobacter modestus TaxID=388466 RepID=A0A4Q7YWK7_9BACT|nr:response regulator transcription factor [Edaphobacter modestus]RZU42302.1 winged helix family two component transcriptional regulator [Edaphobacter modestus]
MNQGIVLIVEDDSALRHSLTSTLQALGFEVMQAANGEMALAELRNHKFEIVLLDLNMPGMGGISACEKIRNTYPKLPIIVLTVRDRDEDKIAALDAGADDYVTKPFGLPELAARIRAGVRRMRQPDEKEDQAIEVGDLRIDPTAHRITKKGVEIHMTPKEFELMHILMRHAGNPIAHHKLLTEVWGQEYGNEREYLRTYISQLRRKIEDDPATPQYLLTENYVGYRFQQPAS